MRQALDRVAVELEESRLIQQGECPPKWEGEVDEKTGSLTQQAMYNQIKYLFTDVTAFLTGWFSVRPAPRLVS